jgi:hypothetical protein
MTIMEKFIRNNYTPTVEENKDGLQCVFRHKDGLTEDSVVYFEFAKTQWTKKPVMSDRKYVIVDANMGELLEFLHTYFNLQEDDYHQVRRMIIDMAMSALDKFYGD